MPKIKLTDVARTATLAVEVDTHLDGDLRVVQGLTFGNPTAPKMPSP